MTNAARATRGAGAVKDPDRPAAMTADLRAHLGHRDAEAAPAWLSEVGFGLVRRQDAEDGSLARAGIRCGDVVLMVAGAHPEHSRPALPSARRRGRPPARTLRRRSSSHREACPDLVIGDTFTA